MQQSNKAWRCLICGYIHHGAVPPMECPVCSAGPDAFEAIIEEPAGPAESPRTMIIVGAGIAGLSAAEAAREQAENSRIILLSNEIELPYHRLNLTRYIAGEIPQEELTIHPQSWYTERRIELKQAQAIAIDRPHNSIKLSNQETLSYDRLVLTTGAQPHIPALPGNNLPHVSTLRTQKDASTLLNACSPRMKVIIMGGGILGLEMAAALARRGTHPTILERHSHLMPRQLNPRGAERLQNHLEQLGIRVLTQTSIERIEPQLVYLDNQTTLEAEHVVIATGIQPDCTLAQQAGLATAQGVIVDACMQTNDPLIYAAGDLCEHNGQRYGSWAAAQLQGRTAGRNAAGSPHPAPSIPREHSLKVVNKPLFSIGRICPRHKTDQILEQENEQAYCMMLIHNGELAGALLMDDLARMPQLHEAVTRSIKVGAPPDVPALLRIIEAG